jgi:hypothetical protein
MSDEFTNNFSFENSGLNSFFLFPEWCSPFISPSLLLNLIYNDSISLSPKQYNQDPDSINGFEENFYNPNDSFPSQSSDPILLENNNINEGVYPIKEKEKKEEDKQNINNNNNDHDNNNIIEKEKLRKSDKIDKNINIIKEKERKEEDKQNINNNEHDSNNIIGKKRKRKYDKIDKDINTFKKKKIKEEDKQNINNNDQNTNNILGKKRKRKHDKTAIDNIKRKIQVNYIKFLRNLLNQINNELLGNNKNNKNIQFFPLNSNFMKSISSKFFDKLKEQNLGDIFKDNVSQKYKNYQNLNIEVYNEITYKSETIKKILDKKYLEFFYVYYSNIKTLKLSEYDSDSDKIIKLSSNIGFFKDLLTKADSDYKNKIKKCITRYFITNYKQNDKPIFFIE